jgi:hypothetical protein
MTLIPEGSVYIPGYQHPELMGVIGADGKVYALRKADLAGGSGGSTDVSALAKEITVGNKFGVAGRITKAVEVTLLDNTIITPALGKQVRLYWLGMACSESSAGESLVRVRWSSGGPDIYRWTMGSPGAFSHWEPVTGAVDAALIVTLEHVQKPVQLNFTYAEV